MVAMAMAMTVAVAGLVFVIAVVARVHHAVAAAQRGSDLLRVFLDLTHVLCASRAKTYGRSILRKLHFDLAQLSSGLHRALITRGRCFGLGERERRIAKRAHCDYPGDGFCCRHDLLR
jgi:hypothetical protein